MASALWSVTPSLTVIAHTWVWERLSSSPASVSNFFFSNSFFVLCSIIHVACHRLMFYLCFCTLQSNILPFICDALYFQCHFTWGFFFVSCLTLWIRVRHYLYFLFNLSFPICFASKHILVCQVCFSSVLLAFCIDFDL